MDLIHTESDNLFASYFKIGPWISFCLIKNQGQPWYGSELFPVSRKTFEKRTILPPYIHGFLQERAKRAKATLEEVSEKQQGLIDKAILEADFLDTGQQMFDAIYEDFRVFGDAAFKKKVKKSTH
ncbi:hypothetical protein K4K94_10290 [Phaeobacter inhibens]|uniref:hypothetical protein n=1 Tax=Phaeobacter inhibens TaxID=221822 RepID=UPI0021A61E72|nr:hypothetical protein [Phaeobacter inhibens]UWR43791.1 hypothetical protein K4F86_10490 [Phaeobacter inhibens]UWS02716.1 hypothetical protein K4K94_10290 [Phaeobacter inhibens]